MKVPIRPWTLMAKTYFDILPAVHRYLNEWKDQAQHIPDPELRLQALMSINTKTFHCEGGSICALLAGDKRDEVIRFIVAYQTISDYLDNLCDRSTSQDPMDFHNLHKSMLHALTPGAHCINYYQYRNEQDDEGYLEALVQTCQKVLENLPAYVQIAPALHELAGYYCDLQVLKHIKVTERIPRLKEWFDEHRENYPELRWYEFCACAGSTLGIFCLISYAFRNDFSNDLTIKVKKSYFPWVQGLHILLDYFIDQEEDRLGGDLNFCSFYNNADEMLERLTHFIKQADKGVSQLPHAKFHQMINRGLLGIYLADKKVKKQRRVQEIAKKIGRRGGLSAFFFYINGWFYRRMKE